LIKRRGKGTSAAVALCVISLAAVGPATAHTHTSALRPAAAALLAGWGTAEELPGMKALNNGGGAKLDTMSCASAGNCSTGGGYTDAPRHTQAFVATETSGTWGTARPVPGLAALNTGGNANISTVSCASPGNCSAGGYYTLTSGLQQAFVVSETSGIWHSALEVPGTAALNQGAAQVNSLSCASPGNCGAGGFYTLASGVQAAFVVTESGGTWATAETVPGSQSLNAGGKAAIESVSCTAPGECSAGGSYASKQVDVVPTLQALGVSQSGGTWGSAVELPGTAALNAGGWAEVNSVSCTSAGNCGAGGWYTGATPATEAFVVTETNGTWGTATEVSGIAALNARGLAAVDSVSCVSTGNCSAGGYYQNSSFVDQAFVVSEVNGTWGSAEEVPGTAALNQGIGGGAAVSSVSCNSPGNCDAGGYYTDSANSFQAFVVSEVSGTWGNAGEVPGTAPLNQGGHAQVLSVSCSAPGICGAGGYYTDSANHQQPFVVSEG
jgi:hypothetical protein